jgi:hypothetical protein
MTLGQKRFVLAAKTHLCWRAQHPPAVLCQHKCLSLLARVGSKSARKSRTFSRKSRDAPRLPPSREASSTTTPNTHLGPYAVLILLILYYTECKSVFWGTKRIQIKNFSTTKFHNFLRVFPFEVNYEIWISNLRDSNLYFIDNMISNKKFVNYKVS